MSDRDDLLALQQAVLSVQDMRDALREYRAKAIAEGQDVSDRIATTEVRLEGFYWVILGQNPPEIAYWERGEWWLAGDPKPWHPEAVTVVSDRLVFKPRLAPVA
jgi:hypothetical protein